MSRTKPKHVPLHHPAPAPPTEMESPPRAARLTQLAFVLATALVVTRATLIEILRDPFDVSPGGTPVPRGPGPATGLWLDLLCCLPAVLILLRRIIDKKYVLRWSWSHVLMGLLGIWAVISRSWAADKFAAEVSSFHLLCAFVLLWSMTQLVRSWLRLRLVAAVSFGLLLVLLAHGFEYRFVEYLDMQRSWEQKKDEILKERGWAPGSFSATQFEKRVVGGEVFGFSASPNTFGAELVLLAVITLGIAIQHWLDNPDQPQERGTVIIFAVALALTAWMLVYTRSKTTAVTPTIAVALLAAVWKFRTFLARRRRTAYWTAVAAVAVAIGAVIAHGLYHHRLPGSSLTFRWQYWVGAAGVIARHPWLGVGWENFGPYYLAHRLPMAAEEIKDPHNFLVRALAELGIVGGVLTVGWLLRLWWELVQPIAPPANPAQSPVYGKWFPVLTAAAIGILAVTLNAALGIDWAQSPDYVIYESLRRLLLLGVFVIGTSLAALRSLQHPAADDRPAPWILYATLTGLAVFLLHNTIDFSLFELGPMYVFAMLTGSALGLRAPTAAGQKRRTLAAATALALAAIAWLLAALAFALPISEAEALAHDADENLRAGKPQLAAAQYREAFHAVPSNADYAFRAARALTYANAPADQVRAMLVQATSANPTAVEYWLWRASFESQMPEDRRDYAEIRRDYQRVLDLNPNDAQIRLQYAAAMEKHDPMLAAQQYRTALEKNALLNPDEIRRLPPEKVRELESKIRELQKADTRP